MCVCVQAVYTCVLCSVLWVCMEEDTCTHARVVQCFVGMYIHVCVSSVRDYVRGLCRNCYIFFTTGHVPPADILYSQTAPG